MQATIINESSVKINFGGEIPKGHNQLDLQFILDFFSAEQQGKRKQLESNLNIQLPSSSLVLQLLVGANSAEIADKLNNSPMVKQIKEQSPASTNYYSHGNKLIIVVTGEELNSFFQTHQANYAHLKNQLNESHKIHLNLSSKNSLAHIANLIKEKKSFSYGFLESLQLHFGFEKSPASEKIVIAILENGFGFGQISHLFKSFKKVNLQLNCASARSLDDFPKISLRPLNTKPTNQILAILQQAKIQAAHLYVLNSTLFLKGNFDLAGFTELLPVLFD